MCTKSIKLMVLAISTKKSPFKSFLSDFILYSLMKVYLKNYKPLETIFLWSTSETPINKGLQLIKLGSFFSTGKK